MTKAEAIAMLKRIQEQEPCEDTISRQAAIDIERNATVDTKPSHFEAHQKFTQFVDDAEISSFGRWQWSNGFNTALTAVVIGLRKLPPAQPERIRGQWIEKPHVHGVAYCSLCDYELHTNDTNFCPNCGADMRGVRI